MNNPILMIDPTGMAADTTFAGQVIETVVVNVQAAGNSASNYLKNIDWKQEGMSALYGTPVVGSSRMSSQAFASGDYIGAATYFGFGMFEIFTLGIGTNYTLPVKQAALMTRSAAKGIDGLLKAGRALDKGGLTVVGRALQKHGSRTGSIFPKTIGNAAAINTQGENVLKGILTNSRATTVTRHHGRFGNIMDIQIPGGQGARFSADGKTFIHFLEP